MFILNRLTEIETLGYCINHVLKDIDKKEVFLVNLYTGVMDIIIEVLNDPGKESLYDKLDIALRSRTMTSEVRFSIFDYLLNLIERIAMSARLMRHTDDTRYRVEIRNNHLTVGKDIIYIDFDATYYSMMKKYQQAPQSSEDVVDNPTEEDIERIVSFK